MEVTGDLPTEAQVFMRKSSNTNTIMCSQDSIVSIRTIRLIEVTAMQWFPIGQFIPHKSSRTFHDQHILQSEQPI